MKDKPPDYNLEEYLKDIIVQCGTYVYKSLGPGYPDEIYKKALAVELTKCGVKVEEARSAVVYYEKKPVGQAILDIIAVDKMLILVSAAERLTEFHTAKMNAYLKAAIMNTGILVNFGLEIPDFVVIDI